MPSASKGHVVGFMGDGINDAPALRAADFGISVDTATDIAKESADLILLEKDLMVLEGGVTEGRKVFANILKYIRMGASSNFGNMFSVVGASAFLPFLPMAPIQVLTNNLLYDFSQVPIPTDAVDEEQVSRPRPWNIGEIKRFIFFIGPISSIFDYTTFFVMLWVFKCWDPSRASRISDGLVRRIANDPNAHHSRHSNQSDSLHTEPGEFAADDYDVIHHGPRGMVAVFSPRLFAGACAPAGVVLADPDGDPALLCWAYPTDQGLVTSKEVDLKQDKMKAVILSTARGTPASPDRPLPTDTPAR